MLFEILKNVVFWIFAHGCYSSDLTKEKRVFTELLHSCFPILINSLKLFLFFFKFFTNVRVKDIPSNHQHLQEWICLNCLCTSIQGVLCSSILLHTFCTDWIALSLFLLWLIFLQFSLCGPSHSCLREFGGLNLLSQGQSACLKVCWFPVYDFLLMLLL